MKVNSYGGKFIVIDGPNGVGKTTIIEGLQKELKTRNIDVYFTKEPTETELGKFVRDYAEKHQGISVATLVAADRYQHISEEIIPQLKKGKIVISDRYVLSSLILQRMDEVCEEFILVINSEIIQPDLQIGVLADNDIIQDRLKNRNCLTRFEKGKRTSEELKWMELGLQILEEKGVNVLRLKNDSNLKDNVISVVEKIMNL